MDTNSATSRNGFSRPLSQAIVLTLAETDQVAGRGPDGGAPPPPPPSCECKNNRDGGLDCVCKE
jgi:hypothetical protein